MTVLAAMHDPKHRITWLGSDTFATIGPVKFETSPKWIVGSAWAVGCAGDGRLQTLIGSRLVNDLESGQHPVKLAEKIRDLVKEDGWNTDSERGAPDYGVWLMLANRMGVWSVCSAFSVDEIAGYWADGSGGQVAMGAMYVAQKQGLEPREIVHMGVDAAIRHEHRCGGSAWLHGFGAEVTLPYAAVGD